MELEASTIACTSNYPRYRRTASNRSCTTRRNPSASTLPLFHHIRRRFVIISVAIRPAVFCTDTCPVHLTINTPRAPRPPPAIPRRPRSNNNLNVRQFSSGPIDCSRQRRTSTGIAIVPCIRPLLNCSTCSNACFQLNKILYRWSQRAMPCVTAPTRDSSYRLLPAIAAITDRTWTRLSIRMYIDKL